MAEENVFANQREAYETGYAEGSTYMRFTIAQWLEDVAGSSDGPASWADTIAAIRSGTLKDNGNDKHIGQGVSVSQEQVREKD